MTTAAPVLVVGNSHDPATPIHGARALHRLLDGTLPPAGTVCRPREQLFP